MEMRGVQPGQQSVYTRPRAAFADTASDRVSLGEGHEPVPGRPSFETPRRFVSPRTQQFLSLVLAGFSFLAATPVVLAQEPASVQQTAASYGLSADTVAALKPDTVAVLRTLPESLMRRYKGLNDRQKEVMGRELRGKTGFAFIKFSNKEALINGSAAGQDAFPIVKERLDENVKKKRITPEEGQALKDAVDELKTLTKEQRAAVVEVILLETS